MFRISNSSSVTLFYRLPDEVVEEIFQHVAHKHPIAMSELDKYTREHLKSLALITSVCSYWREVAISTPKLWTCIIITAFLVKKGVKFGRSVTSTFIKRSKNAAMRIAPDVRWEVGRIFP